MSEKIETINKEGIREFFRRLIGSTENKEMLSSEEIINNSAESPEVKQLLKESLDKNITGLVKIYDIENFEKVKKVATKTPRIKNSKLNETNFEQQNEQQIQETYQIEGEER